MQPFETHFTGHLQGLIALRTGFLNRAWWQLSEPERGERHILRFMTQYFSSVGRVTKINTFLFALRRRVPPVIPTLHLMLSHFR